MANKHVKRCLMSLAIREMQIVPMLGHLYTPIRTAKKKIMKMPNADKTEKLILSYIPGGNVKRYSHSGKQLFSFLKNLSYDPGI